MTQECGHAKVRSRQAYYVEKILRFISHSVNGVNDQSMFGLVNNKILPFVLGLGLFSTIEIMSCHLFLIIHSLSVISIYYL